MRPHLVRWQWEDYARYHRDRVNLVVHIVAVPAFWLGAFGLVVNLATAEWGHAGIAALAMVVAYLAEGIGHQREAEAPVPFAGPGDAVARIFSEQFVNFPRYVVSGGWLARLRCARTEKPDVTSA
jgi:hypothetical protein